MGSNGGTFTSREFARIQPTGYQALLWCSTAISLPFVLFRLYVRSRIFHKLFVDDGFVILAWLLLLAYSTTQQVFLDDLYVAVKVAAGAAAPDANFLYHFQRFLTDSVVSNVLLSLGLWSIKFAFLFFFRRLGTNVNHQRAIWWVLLGFNTACWAIWIGVVDWKCIGRPPLVVLATCNTIQNARFSEASIRVQTAIDVVSDCSILLIPVTLLWRVQIRWQRKLVLAGLFSLVLFTMIASIIRAVITVDGSQQNDDTWLYGWAALELGIAVIVACLASFRALFTSDTLSQRAQYYNHKQLEDDLTERRGLAWLRLTSPGNSSTNMARGRGNVEPEPRLFDPSLRQTETYIRAKNGHSSGGNSINDEHELAGIDNSRHVHVRNEFIVTGETG